MVCVSYINYNYLNPVWKYVENDEIKYLAGAPRNMEYFFQILFNYFLINKMTLILIDTIIRLDRYRMNTTNESQYHKEKEVTIHREPWS